MSTETLILISSWIIMAVLLLFLVPRNKVQEAHIIFLFVQMVSWFFGLIVAQFHLIDYPIRWFPQATRTSFTFEFFVYPGLSVLFNLHYPEGKGVRAKLLHYIWFTSGITMIEVVLEHYTDLIDYVKWDWYWTWLSIAVTFFLSRCYYLWYLKRKKTALL